MLSDQKIEINRNSLNEAVKYLGGSKIESMVFYATLPVSLFVGAAKRIDRQVHSVQFVYDKNWPKIHIEGLGEGEDKFHTEFSVAWLDMKFNTEKSILIIKGKSEKAKNGYELHLHVRGKRASRDA